MSEIIGFALNIRREMMEYWNVGMLDFVECDLILYDGMGQKLNPDRQPF
jgi:hypothetical protein